MTAPTDLVLLLPGWGTPPSRLEPMADALQRAGAVARVWSYTPQGALPELVDQFTAAANATLALHEPGDRLHLVGHSLGGVVAAATALRRLPDAVTSVTTINTPWRGSWVSYTGTGPLARALRWGSPTLEELRAELSQHLANGSGPRWLLLSAAGDLATPATTSLGVAGSSDRLQRRVVAATGHSVSLTSERLIEAVREHIRTAHGLDRPVVCERTPHDDEASLDPRIGRSDR